MRFSPPSLPPYGSHLRDRVGHGGANLARDVWLVKAALARLGRYHGAAHGIIDRKLVDAIRGYQRDRGLRRDGVLHPGGETELSLRVENAYLAQGEAQ